MDQVASTAAPGIEHEKAAFDALPDGVLIADEAGTVVLVNLAGCRALASKH